MIRAAAGEGAAEAQWQGELDVTCGGVGASLHGAMKGAGRSIILWDTPGVGLRQAQSWCLRPGPWGLAHWNLNSRALKAAKFYRISVP